MSIKKVEWGINFWLDFLEQPSYCPENPDGTYTYKLPIVQNEINNMTTYQDLENNYGKEHLYGWIITYNPYKGVYLATNRDNYAKLFSQVESEAIIKSVSISALEEMIIKNEGDLRRVIENVKNLK